MSNLVCSYEQAVEVKEVIDNLGFPNRTSIVLGIDREDTGDVGEAQYEIKKGDTILNAAAIWKMLKTSYNCEVAVKRIAGELGVTTSEIEAILSNMSDMMELRRRLFATWLKVGRPGMHIYRS